MIKQFINYLNNLESDLSVWHDNYTMLEKEKFYKGRKIILLVHKRQKNWEGKILVMTYQRDMMIEGDDIVWEYKPNKLYKSRMSIFNSIETSNEKIQEMMENLFTYYFLEKQEKLKFKK